MVLAGFLPILVLHVLLFTLGACFRRRYRNRNSIETRHFTEILLMLLFGLPRSFMTYGRLHRLCNP